VANPVVAALPDGSFAVAWAGFDEADDDELAILLQRVDPELGPVGGPTIANATLVGAQHSPDILWAGDELVVAWSDESDVGTSPDLRYRTFSSSLISSSAETTLAATDAVEGGVSLAPFGASWAAAWRSGELSGLERVVVSTDVGTFSVPDLAPGATGDRPALAELDESHLLLAFTNGTDPDETGVLNTSRLRYAILDSGGATELESAALPPLRDPYASQPALGQSQPSLVRAGDSIFLAWRSDSIVSPLHEEVWM
jgi:hypothetical protein